MRFFLDRCCPLRVAHMLACLEPRLMIRHFSDDPRFEPKTSDVDWITTIGTDSPPWTVLSFDHHILKRSNEKAALTNANLTFFAFSSLWSKMNIYEQTWKFFKVWPDLLKQSETAAPTLFEVNAGSSLKIEKLGATRS